VLGHGFVLQPGDSPLELLDLLPDFPSPAGVTSAVELQKEVSRLDAEDRKNGEEMLELEIDGATEELGKIPLALSQGPLNLPLRDFRLADRFPESLGKPAELDFW
jgi:hypothetical protein